jgi:glutamyl-tRNA reductase
MICVVGLSHKTAPLDIREKFATSADVLPEVLARLASRTELREVMFLSTCNRVEVFASAAAPDQVTAAVDAARAVMCDHAGAGYSDEVLPYFYERRGPEAMRHIFRVAASLDSMVLGEPQILGQVKEAYEAAIAAGTLRSTLARCMSKALAVAKRVRTETEIGAGTVSISSVAVDLATRIFGDLSDRTVLLLGAGEMAEAAARSLVKGARALRICNRSFDRAAALAGEMHAAAVPWDALGEELAVADVVVASTASTSYVVTRKMVQRAMKQRKGRTLLLVDIAVPRNVEPTAHGIDNAYVFNVDDLEQEVARGRQARHLHVDAANAIVEEGVAEFLAWRRGLEVQPTLVAMRAKVRAVLLAELESSLRGRLKHLGEADRAALTQMVESGVGKLLHAPTARLKARAAEGEDGQELAAAARYLFDLHEPTSSKEAEPGEGEVRSVEEDEPLPN